MWKLAASAVLVVLGVVALVEDHRYRPEYGCTARTLHACESGEGLHPIPGRLAETPYNILGGIGWAMTISGAVLALVVIASLVRALKR